MENSDNNINNTGASNNPHTLKTNKIDKFTKIVLVILSLSILFNIYLLFNSSSKIQGSNIQYFGEAQVMSLDLIDPGVAKLDLSEFLKTKQEYIASYTPLRKEIEEMLANTSGHFGIYFEDLYSHSWFGINEREKFNPASLLKITTVASILSLVEEKALSLDTKVELTEDDLDYGSGTLYKTKGSNVTVEELIKRTLVESDNVATITLLQLISGEKWIEARLGMGLPLVSIAESANGTSLNPEEISNVFHSLYYAGYLSRASSNWVLSLLSETDFKEGIPAGVPDEIKVAHKIGIWAKDGEVHDCGIVYAKRPYILCIMSLGVTQQGGNEATKEISQIIYNYVSTH